MNAIPWSDERVALLRALRDELGLTPPFSAGDAHRALARVRAARDGVPASSVYPCARHETEGTYIGAMPDGWGLAERTHRSYHQIGHIELGHIDERSTVYTPAQEDAAEAFADAMLVRVVDDETTGWASAG